MARLQGMMRTLSTMACRHGDPAYRAGLKHGGLLCFPRRRSARRQALGSLAPDNICKFEYAALKHNVTAQASVNLLRDALIKTSEATGASTAFLTTKRHFPLVARVPSR